VPVLWVPPLAKEAPASSGVFGHLKAKGAPAPVADMSVPPKLMTWEKFMRTVMPMASKIELAVPNSADRFMALTTAVNPEAPPLLQWDTAEDRNTFSWYYASGVDAEIKRRVESAGGQYTGVDIRASLIWEGFNDLDLHAYGPRGDHIFYRNRLGTSGGLLDVDANAACRWNMTERPVENIRWAAGTAPEGVYRFEVNHFATPLHHAIRTPFRVEIAIGTEVYTYHGEAALVGQTVKLPAFVYAPSQRNTMPADFHRAEVAPTAWQVTPGTWVPVTAITQSPNLWYDEEKFKHCGQHVFFLLEGCKDTSKEMGRGFFVEQVRSDLRPVRKVLEAHLAQAGIEGAEEADACGVGISSQDTGNVTLRVTTPAGQMLYTLDRWD
jgi:hypothetical protein